MIAGYKSKRQFFNTYGIILIGSVVAFLVRLVKFDQFSLSFHVWLFVASIILISIMWESLRFINARLDKHYPFERSISGRIALQLFLGACVGLTLRFFIYFFWEPELPFKLDELFLATTWLIYIIATVGVNLGFFTNYFINRWKDSLIVAERLEKEKSQVQFDNLKNQLNPHFLFNALTSLNGLIFENQGLASQFLQHLSKVYRYVLQNKEKNFVPVQTELDFIQNYVFLLRTRFQQALIINFDIGEAGRERAIVPVTLQILIENALKHNIVDKERPLHIDVLTIGDYLVVSNNLQIRKRVGTSNGQGLDNLRSLYAFLSDKPVIIEKTDNRFAVKIPLL
ncbi:MAG: histidine kinase [Marivirga sp.]|nr:histidine kinase [Marivirga sp.]